MEHAQVVATLRPIMDEYGVTVDFEAMDATFMDTGKSFRVLLHMKYIVTNADKPSEQFERLWVSEAMDQQDKGINKALTAAEKNVFAKLFHLSDKDLEDDSNDAAQPAARKAPTQATSRPVTQNQPATVNRTSPAPSQPQAAKPVQAVAPAPRPVTQNGSTSAPIGAPALDKATDQQREGILKIAGRRGMEEIELNSRLREIYGYGLGELTKSDASHFIKVLQEAN
jgi:hypothetical protein